MSTSTATVKSARERFRARLYDMLEPKPEDGLLDKTINLFVVAVIIISVASAVLETVDSLVASYAIYFTIIEIFAITFFSIEYVLRLWTSIEDPRYAHPVWGRLRYMMTPAALIDLIVVAPFYIAMVFAIDLGMLKVLRLFRIFMLLKLVRYSRAVRMLGNVLTKQAETLAVTLTIGLMLLIFASSLMYFVEHAAQPKAFPHIPGTMWWGVVTLTTVGYGDVYPITPLGRFLGGALAVLGVGLFALPAGILASGLSEELAEQKDLIKQMKADEEHAHEGERCPHCLQVIDNPAQPLAS